MQALDGVALRLYPGQVTALVGENGAGKSTIVKILTGIYQPDAGTIALDGRPARFPTAARGLRRRRHRHPPGDRALRRPVGRREHLLGHAPRTRLGLIDWARMNDDGAHDARPRRRRDRPARAAARPRHRQQAPRRRRPRAVDRRPRRHHGRADRRAVAQGDRRALRAGREAQGRGQGDPLHQPQVRRDLPHRRPLHRVPRRPDGRRGADGRGRRGRARHPDGRPLDRHHLPQARTASPARRCCRSTASATRPSSTDIGFSLAPGRDPRLLRPGRRRAQRGDAGALRHHAALARRRQDRRPGRGDPQPGRGGRARHRLRPRGPRRPGRRRRAADLPERHPAVARAHLAPRLPAARRGVPPRPRVHRAGSTCAPRRSTRTSASSRAATSRRW